MSIQQDIVSGYPQPTQPIVGSHDHKTVQCVNCPNEISIPTKCGKCGTEISPLPQTSDAFKPRETATCDRCGMNFKRPADRKRHQTYSCPVNRDAKGEELYYCPFGSTEFCAEHGYRQHKLIDHLRQAHNFGRVERSSGSTYSSYQGQGQSQATPPEGKFDELSISADSGTWHSGQNPSIGERPEQGIARKPQHQINAIYGRYYNYDESLYEDTAGVRHSPRSYPFTRDSGKLGEYLNLLKAAFKIFSDVNFTYRRSYPVLTTEQRGRIYPNIQRIALALEGLEIPSTVDSRALWKLQALLRECDAVTLMIHAEIPKVQQHPGSSTLEGENILPHASGYGLSLGALQNDLVDLLDLTVAPIGPVSSVEGPPRKLATFKVWWEVPELLKTMYRPGTTLSSVLAVSGSARNAQVTTCKEYMDWRWPLTGLELLSSLDSLIADFLATPGKPAAATKLNGLLSIDILLTQDYLRVTAFSDYKRLTDIGQALGWLCAAVRNPVGEGLTYSNITYKWKHVLWEDTVLVPGDSDSGTAVYGTDILLFLIGTYTYYIQSAAGKLPNWESTPTTVIFDIYPSSPQPVPIVSTSCWHRLLQNTPIARGSLIRERIKGIGLELPFDAMIYYAMVRCSVKYRNATVLMGYKTVLIPVAIHTDGSIQWHLVVSNEEVNLEEVWISESNTSSSTWQDISLEKAKNARNFVGWSKKGIVKLGTEQPSEKVGYTRAKTTGRHLQWQSISIGGKIGLTGGGVTVATTFEPKINSLAFNKRTIFDDMLSSAAKQVVILYDVSGRRAWLVPKICAMLFMSHIYLRERTMLTADLPLAEPSADPSLAAYISIRKRAGEPILPKGMAEQDLGGKEPYRFEDLLEYLYHAIKSAVIASKEAEKPMSSRWQLDRGRKIYGWELVGVATLQENIPMKEWPVAESSGPWPSLHSDVPIFLCKGLGDIIVPDTAGVRVCDACALVPQQRDYLSATIGCIRILARPQGAGDRCDRLSSNLAWRGIGDPFRECPPVPETCNVGRLQQLRPGAKGIPLKLLEPEGFVVFGNPPPEIAPKNEQSPTRKKARWYRKRITVQDGYVLRDADTLVDDDVVLEKS